MSLLSTAHVGIDLRLVIPFEPSPTLIKRTERGNKKENLNTEKENSKPLNF
nr:MAG TPA: hypothetical protein [Caudoviricetes sp.]